MRSSVNELSNRLVMDPGNVGEIQLHGRIHGPIGNAFSVLLL